MRKTLRNLCIVTVFIVFLLIFKPECPLHKLTGIQCMFCGGTRMLIAILHLDFKTAFILNPFLYISIIPICVFMFDEAISPNKHILIRKILFTIFLVVGLIFMILRNVAY